MSWGCWRTGERAGVGGSVLVVVWGEGEGVLGTVGVLAYR